MTTPQGTPATPETPAAPVQPAPDSPEYRAAMVAAYEAQGGNPDPAAKTPETSASETPKVEVDPNAPVPRLTDKPADDPKPEAEKTDPPAEKTAEGEEGAENKDAPKAPSLGDLFTDGTFVTGFNSEKLPESLSTALEAAGLTPEMQAAIHEQFRSGQAALQRETTASLHKAAGGKEQFEQLVAWGQKNLTKEQAEFYDAQLNGPMAADAIALLTQKMNAGRDPNLVNVAGAQGGPVSAFRDQTEMMAAMSDPRYQTSEAFRAEVATRLRLSTF
ncbi:capsid assembly protein [Ralstonia solanacearum]|uniref:capsid assembly protein n=1 Tax=Ralstonia solanacearum TaxID=305 RepID=UPI0018D168ED|nr:hypothetical protein [Ralstonia solanacearum]